MTNKSTYLPAIYIVPSPAVKYEQISEHSGNVSDHSVIVSQFLARLCANLGPKFLNAAFVLQKNYRSGFHFKNDYMLEALVEWSGGKSRPKGEYVLCKG